MKTVSIFMVLFSIISCGPTTKSRILTCSDIVQIEDSVDRFELFRDGYDELRDVKLPNANLVSLTGEIHRLHETGKSARAIVLDFWYIGCAPCEAEMPYLQELKESQKDVEFISIARNSAEELETYIGNEDFNWSLYLADEIKDTLCIRGYPTKFILNENYEIQNMFLGGSTSEDQIVKHMDQLTEEINKARLSAK